MWEVTGWALITFIKVTVGLALAVGITWLVLGDDSGWFWLITGTAVVVELFLGRQLVREWSHEASFRWWWTR